MKAYNFAMAFVTAAAIFTGAALNASTTIASCLGTVDDDYDYYFGQSFTVSGSYYLNSISIYKNEVTLADGTGSTLYLFASAYSGTPGGLSSSSYVATGSWDSVSDSWVFSGSYTLTEGTTYYFYSDTSFNAGVFYTDVYASGMIYYCGSGDSFGYSGDNDLCFSVTGTAVPEPATCTGLIGLIALGAAGGRKLFVKRKSCN